MNITFEKCNGCGFYLRYMTEEDRCMLDCLGIEESAKCKGAKQKIKETPGWHMEHLKETQNTTK